MTGDPVFSLGESVHLPSGRVVMLMSVADESDPWMPSRVDRGWILERPGGFARRAYPSGKRDLLLASEADAVALAGALNRTLAVSRLSQRPEGHRRTWR